MKFTRTRKAAADAGSMSDVALADFPKRRKGVVTAVTADASLTHRLLDMGFVQGAEIMLLHEGPLGRDPLAVHVDNSLVAIRRSEAAHVRVSDAAP
jgi:ferrous iron transport protein A